MPSVPINIETLFSESIWLKAEELYDNKHYVFVLNSLKRKIYDIQLQGDKTFQIKIDLNGSKVKTQCSCQNFKQKNECVHILYALLEVRKNETQEKKEKVSKQSGSKQFSVKQILTQIKEEELKHFIRAYASKESSFNLALKTYFANKIDLADNDLKYASILGSAVLAKTHKHPEMTGTERKNFHRILDNLSDTAKDSIALQQYREAMYILFQCLDKVYYVRTTFKHAADRLAKQEAVLIEVADQLLEADIPPELFNEVKERVLRICMKSYFTPVGRSIFSLFIEKELFELVEIKEIFDKLLYKSTLRSEHQLQFLQHTIFCLKVDFILVDEIIETLNLTKLIERLIAINLPSFEAFALELCTKMIEAGKTNKRLEHFYILKMIDKKAFKLAISYMAQFHEKYEDNTMSIRQIKYIDPEDRILLSKKIVKILPNLEAFDQAKLFELLENYDALIELIASEKDLTLLWEYDELIGQYNDSTLYELYESCLTDYLNHYIGNQGKDAFQRSCDRLRKLGHTKMLGQLKETISSKFIHRETIQKL